MRLNTGTAIVASVWGFTRGRAIRIHAIDRNIHLGVPGWFKPSA
jgi:hypothetical protein